MPNHGLLDRYRIYEERKDTYPCAGFCNPAVTLLNSDRRSLERTPRWRFGT